MGGCSARQSARADRDTDADTAVAADWLSAQLDSPRGARAIGGQIELDPAERKPLDPQALVVREHSAAERMQPGGGRATPDAAVEHPHFSGASLA